ncbi:hypothetical protein BT67DRAFT_433571 [Trichocladium antarcticum]|uniref:N-acetyltransferase domain-containing protein n=1 Tax=Trichocladium antarcticum TaxID=1450529 RepID=A0AAN6UMH6_9PEZI|nr:hypothetical protein BT67DRAFT_433571 [Trichocladium antarcticum]
MPKGQQTRPRTTHQTRGLTIRKPPNVRPGDLPVKLTQRKPRELEHTVRPRFIQSFVPADPGATITTPEAQEHKLGAAQADITGDEVRNSEIGRQGQRVSGPTNQYSPDLTGYPMPFPNKSYHGSWPSTPSSISTINISETGLGEANSKPDIRNTIAMQNDINKSGNTWFMQDWNHVKGADKDEALRCEKYIDTFIGHWANAIPGNVEASFSQESGTDHWKCDFNTNTGSLLPPVNYPDTLVDLSRVDRSIEWQRLNWTATLLMERTKSRHNPGSDDPPPDCRKDVGNVAEKYAQRQNELEIVDPRLVKKICDERYQKPEFNEFVPRIPCFLRPAEKYDMEAVQRIYNWEVEHGLQALDSHPVPVESFEGILSTAQKLEMPFIVAVRGSARKLGLTKGNLLYSPYRQRPTDELDPQGRRRCEILGFAFLSVWEPGVGGGLGSGLGTSRATAKINVCVHPDYRRKKIGFSLVDMLLTTVSDRYSSQSGFDFVDPDNSPVYKSPASHSRQYFRLYFHHLVKHQHVVENNKKLEQEQKEYDNDLVWVRKMFDEQLGFTELVRFEAAHRSAKGRDGPVYWLDQVVFEHACYFAPSFIKDDY